MRSVQPVLTRSLIVAAVILLSGVVAGAQVERTEIVATDNWPATSGLDMGVVRCPGEEVVWLNPVTPVCPTSGNLKIRRSLAYSCLQAASVDGEPESRFTGVASLSINANLDASYSGPVWGTWTLVPSATCDPQVLVDPQESWQGTWQGKRAQVCNEGQCYMWVGSLKFVGRGYGGELQGQRFKGRETVVTLSPLPVPLELLGVCTPSTPCPPEGHMVGTIRKR